MQLSDQTSWMSLSGYTGTVGVVALPLDGLGDVAGADKIASVVAEIMPKAQITFAIFKPHVPEMSAIFEKELLPRSELVKVVQRPVIQEGEFLQKISSLGCLILYPTYQDSHLPKELRSACKRHGIPVIKFRESGAGPGSPMFVEGKAYPMGVGRGECGIIFPVDLYHYYLAHRNDSPEMRLQNLKDLSPDAQQLILGSPFSLEALAKFQAEAKLYVGYCRGPLAALDFTMAVAQLEKSQRAVVYIMNENLDFEGHFKKEPPDFKALQRVVFKNGFKTVCITEKGKTRSYNFPADKCSGTRTLHIILGSHPSLEAIALLKASESETLATGEQSVWEQWALGKRMSIEFSHQRFEELKSYIELMKRENRALGDLFQKCILGDFTYADIERQFEGEMVVTDARVAENMLIFFKMIRDKPLMQQGWEKFIDKLYREHSFRPNLERILQENMVSSKNKKSAVD